MCVLALLCPWHSLSIAIFVQTSVPMSEWWKGATWSGWNWQRRAQDDLQPPGTPSAYPPTGPAGRPRKRGGSSRGAQRGDPRPRVAPDARASTVMPPRPPRLPQIVLPTYPTVAAFDDPRAPWPRESPTGGRSDFEPTAQLSEYCQNRWFLYCRKFTPMSVFGWRPSFSGKNAFLCHESRTVFPALYQVRGHARADDEQALRQAGRAGFICRYHCSWHCIRLCSVCGSQGCLPGG